MTLFKNQYSCQNVLFEYLVSLSLDNLFPNPLLILSPKPWQQNLFLYALNPLQSTWVAISTLVLLKSSCVNDKNERQIEIIICA